jgi:hypothetical protein
MGPANDIALFKTTLNYSFTNCYSNSDNNRVWRFLIILLLYLFLSAC